jgi:hypothetical protein
MGCFYRSGLLVFGCALSLALHAQQSGQWITDSTGCKVWNSHPQPNESITWSGTCEGGFATGEGTVQWFLAGRPASSGTGTFREGKLHGKGVTLALNDERYQGDFVDGLRHGKGVLTARNGARYEGDFKEGKFSGSGLLMLSNGDRYDGEFVEGKRSGRGIYYRASGERLEGDFVDGKPHGNAVVVKPDGTRIVGTATDGKFTASTASAAPRSEKDELASVIDAVAPRDIVTGQRSLNLESEQEELQRASQQAAEILSQAQSKGVRVDSDEAMVSRLRRIMSSVAAVSHRPNLPWEVHLLEAPTVNAFTIGGGKLFFWRGVFGTLINPADDNEIAAVMAHEAAHVTLRHIGKREGITLARALVSNARAGTDTMYRASFTTLQEDEADKVGLLYMSLAGFDPRAATNIWNRAHQRYGSSPGNYTYDHSLNADRVRKISGLVPTALRYFKGSGQQNPDYARLRSDNDLIPRSTAGGSDNGVLALLEAGLGIYTDNLKAKNEQISRKIASQQASATSARIVGFKVGNTTAGTRGFFGQIQNTGQSLIGNAQITVAYVNAAGKTLHAQQVHLSRLRVPPGSAFQWSGPLLNVPGTTRVVPSVTSVGFAD